MFMKKVFSSLVALLFVLGLLVGCSGGSNEASSTGNSGEGGGSGTEKPVELNLGHILTPDSHYGVMVNELTKVVEEKSNGSIKVTQFPQSQLGDEIKMIQSARSGTISMFVTGQAALENTVKEYEIFDIPYLFDSVRQANEVLSGEVGKKYLKMLEDYELVGLGWLSAMERNVFSTKEIKDVGDMKRLKASSHAGSRLCGYVYRV